MVVCIVGIEGAVSMKYFWEYQECTDVILVCPHNAKNNYGFFMHSCVSRNFGALTQLNESRIISTVDFRNPCFHLTLRLEIRAVAPLTSGKPHSLL
jgi:hypothetical protein